MDVGIRIKSNRKTCRNISEQLRDLFKMVQTAMPVIEQSVRQICKICSETTYTDEYESASLRETQIERGKDVILKQKLIYALHITNVRSKRKEVSN